jgi:DnaJ-domain-containing protein 1
VEGFELIAIVVFFLIGYWIVDFFWPKKKTEAAQPTAAATAEPWHEVLGVSPQATTDQIREAYLAKSAEHHPDRVFDQGPEARETAQRMTRRLNDAFEQAMREPRG